MKGSGEKKRAKGTKNLLEKSHPEPSSGATVIRSTSGAEPSSKDGRLVEDAATGGPGEIRGPQDLLLKAVSAGLSGVFATQESLRKVVGDAVPAEWSDFASEQSDRARAELLDKISDQIAVAIQELDAADVLARLLSDHTVEVSATIRLKPIEDDEASGKTGVVSTTINSLKSKG